MFMDGPRVMGNVAGAAPRAYDTRFRRTPLDKPTCVGTVSGAVAESARGVTMELSRPVQFGGTKEAGHTRREEFRPPCARRLVSRDSWTPARRTHNYGSEAC